MSLNLFKPNKSIKGSLLSVGYAAKTDKFVDGKNQKGDKSFYFNLISQTGWNEETGTGSFKDGKKITVKFAPHEIAGILAAINMNTTLENVMNVKYVYHDGAETATTIYFGPHFKSEKQGDKWVETKDQNGFYLRVVKTQKANKDNKEQIGIGFTYAETELLARFLENGLTHIFEALRAEDINRGADKNKKVAAPKEVESKPETAPEQKEEDLF